MGGAWSHGVTKTTNSSIKHQRRQASTKDDPHVIKSYVLAFFCLFCLVTESYHEISLPITL